MGLSRSSYYKPLQNPMVRDGPVIEKFNEVLEENPQFGFWKCFKQMRYEGCMWNHKKAHRIYCDMNLNIKRRTKKRVPTREPQSLEVIPYPDRMWSMDFMHDTLYKGKKFRTFNVIDEGVRECLAIEIDTSLSAERVVRILERLKDSRGLPEKIRVDNGPEFTSALLMNWCAEHGVELAYIQPGKPYQNAFIERFNRTYRREVLNVWLFEDLEQVRETTWNWMIKYNERRPHDALGDLPPTIYKQQVLRENSTNKRSA